MATNTEAAAVKTARRTTAAKPAAPNPVGNVTGATRAPGVGVDEPPRNYFTLGDPDEPRAVIEASGGPYGAILGDDYVRAPEDAVESFVPDHCTTSVSRQIWCKGQHVPIERFRKFYGEERAAELLAAAATPAEPAPEVTQSEESTPPPPA